MMALTSPGEATTARRLLMNSIGGNNDSLHDMLDGVLPWDDYVFQIRLLSMFAMFKAFPGMFRSEPNPWTAEGEAADPARVSLALPEVWNNWETFTAMNEAAADNALKAAFMTREDAKVVVEELEMQCESCHEAFRTSFDSFRDFDDLLPVGNP
jgi:cytochrome c556